MLLTSGGWVTDMTTDDIALVGFDNTVRAGQLPGGTFEIVEMHSKVYEKRPDIGAIIHSHSPYATAFAIANKPIPCVYEAMARFDMHDGIPVAPYAPRGSKESVANILERRRAEDTLRPPAKSRHPRLRREHRDGDDDGAHPRRGGAYGDPRRVARWRDGDPGGSGILCPPAHPAVRRYGGDTPTTASRPAGTQVTQREQRDRTAKTPKKGRKDSSFLFFPLGVLGVLAVRSLWDKRRPRQPVTVTGEAKGRRGGRSELVIAARGGLGLPLVGAGAEHRADTNGRHTGHDCRRDAVVRFVPGRAGLRKRWRRRPERREQTPPPVPVAAGACATSAVAGAAEPPPAPRIGPAAARTSAFFTGAANAPTTGVIFACRRQMLACSPSMLWICTAAVSTSGFWTSPAAAR